MASVSKCWIPELSINVIAAFNPAGLIVYAKHKPAILQTLQVRLVAYGGEIFANIVLFVVFVRLLKFNDFILPVGDNPAQSPEQISV
jgi:hypothetical protein